MFLVKHFKDLTVNEFYEIAKARYDVFACEQKITMENDFDNVDKNSYHIFSMDNGIVTSYARIIPCKFSNYDDVSIGRVLVIKNYRNKHLAKNLMTKAIEFVKNDLKEVHITLSAQYYIKNLYSSLGFKEISPIYDECNIPHVKMRL